MASSRTVISAIVVGAILLVGFAVFGAIATTTSGGERIEYDAATLDGVGSWSAFNDGQGTDQTVWKTTGYAVNLTGSDDSYVESDTSYEISSDDTWTVSAWGYVDNESWNDTMALVSADGRVIITYNGSAGNWSVWYYDDGSRDSYQVNVSTSGNEVGNLTNVMAWSNETHLAVYRNNTRGEIKNITTNSVADAPVNATNWDGRLEEVRTFDDALNSSERSDVVDQPTEPHAYNVTSRIMMDQPNRATQLVLYTDARMIQSNVSFSAGFPADVMQQKSPSNDLAGDTDYEWDKLGPQIKPTAGGELEGAPVAYASYDFSMSGVLTLITYLSQALLLGGVVVIVLFAGMVLRVLKDF